MRQAPLLLVVLVVLAVNAVGARVASHNRRLSQWSLYSNILDGIKSEMYLVRRLFNGELKGRLCIECWMERPDFRQLWRVGTDPKARATVFFASDDALNTSAAYWCLTMQEAMDSISNLPDLVISVLRSYIVPNITLTSDQFKEGMKLCTMQQGYSGVPLSYTLGRKQINGTMHWVLKGASFVKIPGTNQYEDVVINPGRTNIRAGKAVMHQISSWIRVPELEPWGESQREIVLSRMGMPRNSTTCPSRSPATSDQDKSTFTAGQVAGLVVGIAGGLLLCSAALFLLARRCKCLRHKLALEGSLYGVGHRGKPGDGKGAAGCEQPLRGGGGGGGGDSAIEVCDQRYNKMVSSYYKTDAQQPSSSSCGSTRIDAGGGGLSPPGSSTTPVSISRGSSVQPPPLAQQPSVIQAETSPFAGCPFDSTFPAAAVLDAQVPSGRSYRSSGAAEASASHSSDGSAPASHKTDSCTAGSSGPEQHNLPSGSDKLTLLQGVRHEAALAAGFAPPSTDCVSYAGPLVPAPSLQPGRISHALIIPFEELELKELIGSGAEGKVYRGTWKHTEIAAKEYLPIEPEAEQQGTAGATQPYRSPSEAARARARAALAKEVHWLTSLNHPNLVRFCAVCLEPPLVVMEFYKHGSVFALMQKACHELTHSTAAALATRYTDYLSWDRRLEMLHDVAAGMSYLHGRNHVHGDLRSPNLFVGADGKVKIGDFGFTKRLAYNKASLKVSRITHPRWVAPELIMENRLSRESDVYSFGVIMYELLTFRIPFDDLRKEQVVVEVIQGFRPPVPPEDELPPGTTSSNCLLSYMRLMQQCWAQNPAARPSFEVIARRLKAMQRWRLLIARNTKLQRAASIVRRSNSLPGMPSSFCRQGSSSSSTLAPHLPVSRGRSAPAGVAPGISMLQGTAGSVTTSLSGWQRDATPAAAAPPAAAATQPETAAFAEWAAALPQRRYASQQLPGHGVAPIPEAGPEYAEELPCELDDLLSTTVTRAGAEGTAAGLAAAPPSLPVSAAVVPATGERLAVIGLPGWQHEEEHDTVASVTSAGLLAQRVLLVGSDLPSPFDSRQLQVTADLPPLPQQAPELHGRASLTAPAPGACQNKD